MMQGSAYRPGDPVYWIASGTVTIGIVGRVEGDMIHVYAIGAQPDAAWGVIAPMHEAATFVAMPGGWALSRESEGVLLRHGWNAYAPGRFHRFYSLRRPKRALIDTYPEGAMK